MFLKRQTSPALPINIPTGTALPDLISEVEAFRGKPMRILEVPALAGGALCGVWFATEAEDLILHAPSESPLHREQFILHELSHMLLRHDERHDRHVDSLPAEHQPAPELTALAEGPVEKVLTRAGLDREEERDAERLADQLAMHMRRHPSSAFSDIFG